MPDAPHVRHWIPPAKGCYAPSSIASLIVETEHLQVDPFTRHRISSLTAIHLVEQHRRGPHWSATQYHRFSSGDALFDHLEASASKWRRNYLYCPSVMDLFTLSQFWARVNIRGCRLVDGRGGQPASAGSAEASAETAGSTAADCPRGAPTDPDCYTFRALLPGVKAEIVRYRTRDRSFEWCRHSQYISCTEDQIAAAIEHRWLTPITNPQAQAIHYHPPQERAHLWCRFYRELCDWWIGIDGGPWGPTVASLGWQFLRHRLAPRTVLHHGHERAGALEDTAIFGGRREVWWAGNIGTEDQWAQAPTPAPARSGAPTLTEPMVHLDVRSMYPYLLSQLEYPIRLIRYRTNMGAGWCLDALQTFGVLARVTLRTLDPEYPYRTAAGTSYPIGTFRTTLCGPELAQAITDGLVLEVHQAATYVMGSPFGRAASELLDIRGRYKLQANAGWELLIKGLSNAMTGKLAQHESHWIPRPEAVLPVRWGSYARCAIDSDRVQEFRVLSGMAWEKVRAAVSIRPMGAAYAYLTAYGRWMMRSLRKMMADKSVLAMDTDGLWITNQSYQSIAHSGLISDWQAGHLKEVTQSPVGRFFGPQHYWYGSGWILSGQGTARPRPGESRLDTTRRQTVVLHTSDEPLPLLYESDEIVDLKKHYIRGTVMADGWVSPPRVHQSG